MRYLQALGVDPGKLVAAGYGQYRPVASNDMPWERAKSCRIDVVLRLK